MKKLVSLTCYVILFGLSLAKAYPAEDTKELTPEQPMTNAVLEKVLQGVQPGVKGGDGRWQMVWQGIPLLVFTDEFHNRLTIIAPAAEVTNVNRDMLMRMIEANFVSALDVRYAAFKGIIWSIFVHPLDSLRERDLLSALQQVVTLVKTTGTTYSSSELKLFLSNEDEGK